MPNPTVFPFIFASALLFSLLLDPSFAHASHAHHHCTHAHRHHPHEDDVSLTSKLLPEELAEEEDMKLYGFGRPYLHHDHDHDHASLGSPHLSGLGNSLNSFRLDGSAYFFSVILWSFRLLLLLRKLLILVLF